jgi:hypothetical protein
MRKAILLMLSIFAFSGCSSIPVKNSTPMANYNKLIVRNINWNETAVSELEGDGMKEFIASQPRLAEMFRAEFEKHIREIRFFDKITYGDNPADVDTLILEPKIYTLKPGGFMPGASYTGLLKTADGRRVGKYEAERRLNQNFGSHTLENIEKLIAELGEDAASRLPYAK